MRIVARENMRPGGGDVEERLEEVGELASTSKGRDGIAEGVEVSPEFCSLRYIYVYSKLRFRSCMKY